VNAVAQVTKIAVEFQYWLFHQQTTNVSILSFMQSLWGLPPLTSLNARQDNLMSAFDFRQPPLAAPTLPVAPMDTIGFHGGLLGRQGVASVRSGETEFHDQLG
jgi:hypothetical protein